MMRCLVVADLHYSLPQFDWLLAAAPQFDLVIFAGDALDIGSFVDFRAQILVVKKYLSLLSGLTRVILCSGNHDLDERSPEGEKISRWVGEVRELGIACDGDSFVHRRHAVHGLPVVGRAAGESTDREPAVAKPQPSGCSDGSGCITRRRRIRRRAGAASGFSATSNWCSGSSATSPSMVISGHVHQSPFIPDGSWFDRLGSTWVFNAGLQPGRPPVYIVLDIDDGTAFWLSAGDAQWIDLNAPLQRPAAPVDRSAELAHILGSDCRSDPGETCVGGRLIMLCRSSPTIARWVPWPAYWCIRSAR